MAPYVYVTTDFGKTWSPLVTAKDPKGVRGYAHVIKEDTVDPKLLFLGTEFGLWVSVDARCPLGAVQGRRHSGRLRCAISWFSRAPAIWCWLPMAAVSG